MRHWVLRYYQVCSNDDPGLTLTYFTAISNLVPHVFVEEKVKTMAFSETTVVYDIKVGRRSHVFVWEKIKLWIFQTLLLSMISKLIDAVT